MDATAELETLVTNGIQHNRTRPFHVKFTGKEIYELISLLEQRALKSECYLDVRQAVYFAEFVREQAKKQGF
jgi:hypothetical protein